MPGLQSLVSAWVKVNQGHGEYFGDVSSINDAASPSSASQQQPVQHQHEQPMQVTPGMTSLSGVIFNEGGVVQRQLQPPSPSSTYNLSKGASFATGATGASTSSPHQENRSLLHSQLTGPQHHSALHTSLQQSVQPQQLGLQHHVPQVHRRRPPSSLSNSFHHVSYHPKATQQAAHPQAGADAILARRKSSGSGGASVGSHRRRDESKDAETSSGNSSSYRRRSRELDALQYHRQDKRDSIHMLSQSITEFERRGPIGADALDRVRDGFSLNDKHHGFGFDDGRNSFGTNDSFRRDLNNIQRQESNRMSNITDSSSDIMDEKTQVGSIVSTKSSSAAIPIPTSSSSGRNMFGKKIRKSHSRTDLVREMALDRNPRGRGGKGSGDKATDGDSINNSPRRNASFLSLALSGKEGEDELDMSGTSGGDKSTVGPLLSENAAAASISGANISTLGTSSFGMNLMQHSPLMGAASTSGVSNLSKSLEQNSSSAVAPGNISLDNSLESHSISQSQVPIGAASATSASIPDRSQILQPGWFPHHSEQEHLIRASAVARRRSSGSHSTLETGNLASRQVAIDNHANLIDQGDQQMAVPVGTTPGASAIQMGSKEQMEATLLSLQADIEYLRTLELQREFVCMECQSSAGNAAKNHTKARRSSNRSSKLHPPSIPENPADGKSLSSAVSGGSKASSRLASSKVKRPSSGSIGATSRSSFRRALNIRGSRTAAFLRDASKRMEELSTRHKRQVKQSTHERAYWQNDMHLKLEKFAMMAKNLNEDAAKRSNEVKETKATLEKVTSERNGLISQVEMLKARVALYEGEGVDYEEMRKEWEGNELQTLADLNRSRKDQDAIIRDLSSRLELAMKTIDAERRQQQQRRQIIFPSSRQNSTSGENSPSSPHLKAVAVAETAKAEDLVEAIKQTSKETARKYQTIVDSAMAQSAAREKELQDRINALERELREKTSEDCSVHIPRSTSTGSL